MMIKLHATICKRWRKAVSSIGGGRSVSFMGARGFQKVYAAWQESQRRVCCRGATVGRATMLRIISSLAIVPILAGSAATQSDVKDADLAKLEKQRCPKPSEFAIVFSFGYAADLMPQDDGDF